MTSVVYFVSDGDGAIKVGLTVDLKRRLYGLAVGSARQLHLIGAVDGDRAHEQRIHQSLREHRLTGEWFKDCPPVRAVIDSIMKLGLDRSGFVVPEPDAKLPTLAEAQALGDIIVRSTGVDVVSGPAVVCGAPRSLLWRLKYRPAKDVYADELTALRSAALAAIDEAQRRADEDRNFVVGICEREEARLLRHDWYEAEEAKARAVLRQAASKDASLVDAKRQRLTAGAARGGRA